ncbi:MAG: hypothetical protein RLZZ600_952 [Actinomycetota bacterium]|jgi:hypothetical protein
MNLRLRTSLACAAAVLAVAPLAGCYQMGDVQDIAACQAFAAAQSGYDKAANTAMANPDDKAKQVEWMGSWIIFGTGMQAAAAIPNTANLKAELGTYNKAIQDAGPGASAATQIELWKKGYATKLVKTCNELAAPITITDMVVK